MLSESFLNQLKYAVNIEDVISSYVKLERAGRHKKALCPFHLEKSPSFVVYEDTQSFYCFGCGAEDVITFIMKAENLDYMEAVAFLAKRAGIAMPEDTINDKAAREKARILELNRIAARFFYEKLLAPEGKQALSYLLNRGLTPKTIKTFGLGYAPDSWDSLIKHLRGKGYAYEEAELAWLCSRNRSGGFYDKFRNRVMFPIIDLRGNIIAFGGRVLDDSKPKYLNSGDTPVFKKSRNLFALNFAKSFPERRLILGEGYMDVISMHQAGFTNAVATLGTAITPEQTRLISRYADEAVIAYDSDEPGQAATAKAARLFGEAGVEAKVLVMEGAKDPDEYIKTFGAGQFKLLIEQAESVTANKLERLEKKHDLSSPEGVTKYLNACVPVLSDIYDKIEREVYAGEIARKTGVSKEIILSRTSDYIRRREANRRKQEWREIQGGRASPNEKLNPDRIKFPGQAAAEEAIIDFLMKNPDRREHVLSRIGPDDFVTEWGKKIFRIILEKLQKDITPELSSLGAGLSVEEMGYLTGIMATKRDFGNAIDNLDDYIDVLLKHKNKLDDSALMQMSPEEIAKRYRKP